MGIKVAANMRAIQTKTRAISSSFEHVRGGFEHGLSPFPATIAATSSTRPSGFIPSSGVPRHCGTSCPGVSLGLFIDCPPETRAVDVRCNVEGGWRRISSAVSGAPESSEASAWASVHPRARASGRARPRRPRSQEGGVFGRHRESDNAIRLEANPLYTRR